MTAAPTRPGAGGAPRPRPRVPLAEVLRQQRRLARGQHCHSTQSLAVIGCHPLGIYTVILLPSLPFSVELTVSPLGYRRRRARPDDAVGAAAVHHQDAHRPREALSEGVGDAVPAFSTTIQPPKPTKDKLRCSIESPRRGVRRVGPQAGPAPAFYRCVPTGMNGATCIFRANLTPCSLRRFGPLERTPVIFSRT